jgi:hypothetical protein
MPVAASSVWCGRAASLVRVGQNALWGLHLDNVLRVTTISARHQKHRLARTARKLLESVVEGEGRALDQFAFRGAVLRRSDRRPDPAFRHSRTKRGFDAEQASNRGVAVIYAT